MFVRTISSLGLISVLAGTCLGQTATFATTGYSEDFDSMGIAGTAAPLGWKHFTTGFGSNSTWAASIPASGANSLATLPVTQAATILVPSAAPAGTNNNGFNAAASAINTTDRVLAGSPTTVAGAILQLSLSNTTDAAVVAGSVLTISFDTIRFTTATTANELPGYWLFISTDGAEWTNVVTATSPNPDITTVANTLGTTVRSVDYTLAAVWAPGETIYFRWVDDNARQTSPDQIIGLNNVRISASAPVPTRCSLADVNADGSVDGSDFVAFVNSFGVADVAIDALADVNTDGVIDGADFVAFINAFTAGC